MRRQQRGMVRAVWDRWSRRAPRELGMVFRVEGAGGRVESKAASEYVGSQTMEVGGSSSRS